MNKKLFSINVAILALLLTSVCRVQAQATGNVDGIDSNGVVQGWVADYSNPLVSIAVHFYIDQLDSNHYAGSVEPFEQFDRPDVWKAFNWPAANHGFVFTIPNSSPNDPNVNFNFRNNAVHHIYAFGIALNGTNTLLGGNLNTPPLPNLPVSLTQPISTNGKFGLAPNQMAACLWYQPAPTPPPPAPGVINGHIEGSFDHFDYWPTLNARIRQDWNGFGINAAEIGHMTSGTLLKFRAAGLPVTVDPPAFTQCHDGTELARLELDGESPSGHNWFGEIFQIWGPTPNPNHIGWFRTKDGNLPYTPDEIVLDERIPLLGPSFDISILTGAYLPGETWPQKKDRARRDNCLSASTFNPGVDRFTGLINDYVEYANAMKLHFGSGPVPRLSVHWNVIAWWEWADEAYLDNLHATVSEAEFAHALQYIQYPLHHGTQYLGQLLQTMCASGTCPDTVYMDMDLIYASETHYALDVLRRNKAILQANDVKFGISLVDACSDLDPPGCVINMAPGGNSLSKIYRDPAVYTPNMLYEESILNTTNYLLINGIIDTNTKIRLGGWTRRPVESGSAINENNIGVAHTAKRVINEYLSLQGFDRSWHPNGLAATYFDNNNFTGSTVKRRDSTVNFDWGTGSPSPAIAPTDFSARWEGQVWTGYEETYTFYTLSDDGVRLWINNQLLIDNWTNHPPTENSATIALKRGQKYNIRLEYFQGGGGATIKLSWSSPSQPKQIIPEDRLFTGTGLRATYYDNDNFTGTTATRTDDEVNFNWNNGSPDPRIGIDTFSARWEGKVVAQYTAVYTFYTLADDGVRLWVGGKLLVDDWNNHPPQENSGTIKLAIGQSYDIKLEYKENVGGAIAVLSWSSASQPKEVIPRRQLYLP